MLFCFIFLNEYRFYKCTFKYLKFVIIVVIIFWNYAKWNTQVFKISEKSNQLETVKRRSLEMVSLTMLSQETMTAISFNIDSLHTFLKIDQSIIMYKWGGKSVIRSSYALLSYCKKKMNDNKLPRSYLKMYEYCGYSHNKFPK